LLSGLIVSGLAQVMTCFALPSRLPNALARSLPCPTGGNIQWALVILEMNLKIFPPFCSLSSLYRQTPVLDCPIPVLGMKVKQGNSVIFVIIKDKTQQLYQSKGLVDTFQFIWLLKGYLQK